MPIPIDSWGSAQATRCSILSLAQLEAIGHTKGGKIVSGATVIPSSDPATRRLHEKRGGEVSINNMMTVALKLDGLAIKSMPFVEMIHNPVAILGALRNAVVSKGLEQSRQGA